ncbi:MAG: hypothetical protein ACI9VR_004724 [Cognaticolwellia sp.]
MFWLLGCLIAPRDYAVLVAQAQDADGDGQRALEFGGLDCDDQAAETYSGAPEQCDGLDNDCDQDVDEDIDGLPVFYPDADTDGFGDQDSGVSACDAPPGFVAEGGDCDDANSAVRPGEMEVCGNGWDDNCDGISSSCWLETVDYTESIEWGASELGNVEILVWGARDGEIWIGEEGKGVSRLDFTGEVLSQTNLPEWRHEFGASADAGVAFASNEGVCWFDASTNEVEWESCGRFLMESVPIQVGTVTCGGDSSFGCAWEFEQNPVVLALGFDAAGRGVWTGSSTHLGLAEGPVTSIFTETQIRSESAAGDTLTLPNTPTSLCLLNQAVVWADAEGTHLTSAAGQTDLLTQTTGTLSCMEAGSEYVLIIPPSNDQVEVVNLSGFGDPAWGAPLVVTLPESDELLVNKVTLAQESGQAYLFIAHGTELRRLELGLGL